MNKKTLFSVIISFLICSITIGFSAFSSEMSISNIAADIRAKQDVRITDVSVLSNSKIGGSENASITFDADSILFTQVFDSLDDYVTLDITITNFESPEMGLFGIMTSEGIVPISLAQVRQKICDESGKCNLGASKKMQITFYPSGEAGLNLNNAKADFVFREIHKISYVGFTNNGYCSEIMEGDTLSVTFTNDIPDEILVYADGALVDSSKYTYSNGSFTMSNVTGEVTIKKHVSLYNIMKLRTNGVDTNIDFGQPSSDTNGDGVNTVSGTENAQYPIYYYRGAVTDNNVLFANRCWKIVRTTETGGVKLFYNGTPSTGNKCTGSYSDLSSTEFIYGYDSFDEIGYIYSDGGNSAAKSVVDEWYGMYMTNYTSKLEDTVWCNDRSISSGGTDESQKIVYNAYVRNVQERKPSLYCSPEDSLTVASDNPSNKLTYPAALLTADELTYAGMGYNLCFTDVYLTNESFWWTMTPAYASGSGYNMFASAMEHELMAVDVMWDDWPVGIRPAVSLKVGTGISGGNGSSATPYIIE